MSESHQGRVELKYSVSDHTALQVLEWSRLFLPPDYGRKGPQRITSLYLDTPTLTFFRWHLEGVPDRFKLRLRAYGDPENGQVFAEIKRKTRNIVRKQRAEVSIAELFTVSYGHDLTFGRDKATAEALRAFVSKRQAFQASPKMLISCWRESLRENTAAGETAVTIDRLIQYQPAFRADIRGNATKWQTAILPQIDGQESCLLELKYMGKPPTWMATIMAKLDGHRVRFSKYRATTEQLARWSNLNAEFSESGVDHADDGPRPLVRAVALNFTGLYAS